MHESSRQYLPLSAVKGDEVSNGNVCLSCQKRAGSDDTCYVSSVIAQCVV
jgi:hypothetical protein